MAARSEHSRNSRASRKVDGHRVEIDFSKIFVYPDEIVSIDDKIFMKTSDAEKLKFSLNSKYLQRQEPQKMSVTTENKTKMTSLARKVRNRN